MLRGWCPRGAWYSIRLVRCTIDMDGNKLLDDRCAREGYLCHRTFWIA